jgi:FlaG/FlaF family flagellin (archaellin)
MKLQSDSGSTYEEVYIYHVTWLNINTEEISTTYIAHTNCLAKLSHVTTQLEALFDNMHPIAIKEVGFGYLLTADQDIPEETKPK